MATATWRGQVVAQSDDTVVVEGNHYFPYRDVEARFLSPSDTHTACPWKGEASYYTLSSPEGESKDAAWYYPEPKDAAKEIKGYVAFWKDVEVTSS